MKTFHVALTGDHLDEQGIFRHSTEGSLALLNLPYIDTRFVLSQAPRADDPGYWDRIYSLQTTAEDIAGVHCLVVLRPWIKASTFANGAADLTVIARSGVGYDKIDIESCTANDVAVFNAPVALHLSTASSALMFMLALAKRLPDQERITRAGRWDLQASVTGMELQGHTLGIVGLGASGRELVRLVAPFAMNVIAHSPHADAAQAAALGVQLTSLDAVFQQSDFISLHASLTPDKVGMIGAQHFAQMKPTAYFINVARGELVDQVALVDTLRARRIAGAGLDVYEVEPLPKDDPLIALDNVILTPHWSPATADVGRLTGRSIFGGVAKAARGEIPDYVINTDVLERPGFRRKLERFAENA